MSADEGEDALRQFGYSKDGKSQRVRVVLARLVAERESGLVKRFGYAFPEGVRPCQLLIL